MQAYRTLDGDCLLKWAGDIALSHIGGSGAHHIVEVFGADPGGLPVGVDHGSSGGSAGQLHAVSGVPGGGSFPFSLVMVCLHQDGGHVFCLILYTI